VLKFFGAELHGPNLDDPANDEASKDRYIALVAGGAVEEGLKTAIARRVGPGTAGLKRKTGSFSTCIETALTLGIISPEEGVEVRRILEIRNAFAHALTPISFSIAEVQDVVRSFWNHPVTDWAGYFAPVFSPRHHFAIVCSEFYSNLVRDPVGTGRPSRSSSAAR
jgi:hypothetical protein